MLHTHTPGGGGDNHTRDNGTDANTCTPDTTHTTNTPTPTHDIGHDYNIRKGTKCGIEAYAEFIALVSNGSGVFWIGKTLACNMCAPIAS